MNKTEAILVIRSLLSSYKSPVNISVLNSDFKDETGIDIPLYEHSNIINFLNSIPETVKLTGNFPNVQVNLVKSKKSAHIVSLVKKQKKDCAKKRLSLEGFKYSSPPTRNLCGNVEDSKKSYKLGTFEAGIKDLHQYLLECPNGMDISEMKKIKKMDFLNSPNKLKLYKIFEFVKCNPSLLLFNGRLYAVEVFKQKVLDNVSDLECL